MRETGVHGVQSLSRFKLLLALSRTPHGLLDMATPGAAAVLACGGIPSLEVTAVGVLTAFAGYTSVYALNDLVDYRNDLDRAFRLEKGGTATHLDELFVRHPLALGLLGFRIGLIWTISWGAVALLGAYFLNPMCAGIFLAACLLESLYCLLLKVTHLRSIVSGMVKTSGAVAAVFAVDPNPRWEFLCALFLWLFFWEIGGQNIPNDLIDLDEDSRLGAKTIPVSMGVGAAIKLILASLVLSSGLGLWVAWVAPGGPQALFAAGISLAGIYLLLIPALKLRRSKSPAEASALFNRASFYPLAALLVALASGVLG